MIAASDPQEFVPSGRQQALKHPGITEKSKSSHRNEDLLLDKFERVSLKEKDTEWWILKKVSPNDVKENWSYGKNRSQTSHDGSSKSFIQSHDESIQTKNISIKKNSNFMEDELYVKGNTAIWSRNLDNSDNINNRRKTIGAYTSHLPITHVLWCSFYCEHPAFETSDFPLENKEDNECEPIPAICMIDALNIYVFTQKGEDFIVATPFQISDVWNTKFGIFLEMENDGHNTTFNDNKASLYSLAFPLDEVFPVGIVINNMNYFNHRNYKLLYTNDDPSICLIYDSQTAQHSLYLIRKVTNNEKLEFLNRANNTFSTNVSNKLKSRLSMWESVNNPNLLNIPNQGGLSSLAPLHHSRSYSSMATVSRCQSPATSTGNAWPLKASRLHQSLPNSHCLQSTSSYFDSSKIISQYNTSPHICLEQVWTEPTSLDDSSTPASKVFLCEDLTNQWYLCYLQPMRKQLALVEICFTHSIKCGKTHYLNAKDAVPIPMLHMLAILEQNGNVSLYSGLNPVGKLHMGGTLVQHTPSPYVRRTLSINSPFPRRSSLLPNVKQTDPKFEDHLLSPVLPESSRATNILQMNFPIEGSLPKAVLNGLRDPVENRITLKYSDGTYYRISLPPITTHPLINNCVVVLKQCLSKEIVSTVLTKWYATRNALGAQDTNLDQEWSIFENLLFELLGYEKQDTFREECPVTPLSNPKKLKHSSSGNEDDWVYLLNSQYQEKLGFQVHSKLNLKDEQKSLKNSDETVHINVHSILFPQIRIVHYFLHLLYEDLKLNVLRSDDLKLLGVFLNKLACDLGLIDFSLHYWKDFPDVCEIKSTRLVGENEKRFIQECNFAKPVDIMGFVYDLMQKNIKDEVFPFVRNVNDRSRDVVEICGLIFKHASPLTQGMESTPKCLNNFSAEENAVLLMTEKGITVQDLDTFPSAIYFIFYDAIWKCRQNPPPNFPSAAYNLLWREDLSSNSQTTKHPLVYNSEKPELNLTAKQVDNELDGMEHVENQLMKLRFPDDTRVAEARKMLQSSKPVPIILEQRPDVSDHDFIEEQEKHLYAVCMRTMALSPGRGMFTLRTSTPVITEPLPTPQLCLSGKAPPRGTTVELNHIDTPTNMNLWPLFHNGVASGLRISPDANNIESTWITFNKPKGSAEQQMEHAGFLMALGLNGHLKNLYCLSTYDYLAKVDEMTSIGVLLGLSAAFRGTSDFGMTKTLSIHVEALLPPTSMELDVHQNVQIAALLGIGLIYQATSHRRIVEVLLSEIGRPPGPEMENSVDRESYSLAAGLSLGLVTLKQGSSSLGLADLNISDQLHYYMVGGNKRPLTGSQRDKYKVPSFQIREGSTVNLDVTSPGATLALGLMYLGSGNKAIADWMAPPETQYMLDFVRPDFLMFRILARALIMWDDIRPTKDWVESQVPSTIRPYCMVRPSNLDIDYEAMNQVYCNIVTGACFALGLKYAGSANEEAFKTLLHFCHMFTNLTIKFIIELAGKPTVETCLNVLLLSASMVMAGTGNLEIMRLVRFLRRRVGVASSTIVTYGSHLAVHMSLGLLFLGGGRYTLSNSPENVAALICAFYPKFPSHSNDNRYHLQAFRHLYVLAVEPRLVIPRDVHSGKICYASLNVVKVDGTIIRLKGPGIIPELNSLVQISVDDERYWPVLFRREQNWDILKEILAANGFVAVKQKAGCLSYVADKLGYHSQLAKSLTQSEIMPWDPSASSIISFTHDPGLNHFCDFYLINDKEGANSEATLKKMLTKITYEAVVKDKLVIVPVISFLMKLIQDMETPSALSFSQLRIMCKLFSCNLISTEVLLALEQQVISKLEVWEEILLEPLSSFLNGVVPIVDRETLFKMASYVIFYDIPFNEPNFERNLFRALITSKYSARSTQKIVNIRNNAV